MDGFVFGLFLFAAFLGGFASGLAGFAMGFVVSGIWLHGAPTLGGEVCAPTDLARAGPLYSCYASPLGAPNNQERYVRRVFYAASMCLLTAVGAASAQDTRQLVKLPEPCPICAWPMWV